MTNLHFYRSGEAIEGEALHYKECGLDNVYLLNGFNVEEYEGEEYVSIADSDGLNKAIGLFIVMHRKAPSGREIRFLRNEMDMSQAQLADILGVSDQSVARWEKGESETPGPAILALRVLFVLLSAPDDQREDYLKDMLQTLQNLTEADETNDAAHFIYCDGRWNDRLAAA